MFSDNYSGVKVRKSLWLWQINCGYGMVRVRQRKRLVIGKEAGSEKKETLVVCDRTLTQVSSSKVGWESSTTPASTMSLKESCSYANNLKQQIHF